jgi:hypothetical protein
MHAGALANIVLCPVVGFALFAYVLEPTNLGYGQHDSA